MTVLEAFREATRRGRQIAYAHETARAIEILGSDIFPYETPDEVRRYRTALCRGIAAYTLDEAIRLAPTGRYALVIGDTADPDTDPDHAWCEAVPPDDTPWWSDPTAADRVARPGDFAALVPQRVYRAALTDRGALAFVAREDVR